MRHACTPVARTLSQLLLAGLLALGLTACSSLVPRDPLHIDLVGLEPLAGQGMEMRFAVVLRVQNPNEQPLDFNGVALELEINDQPLASGVSDQGGQVPRFGELLLRIPVSISAFSALRRRRPPTGQGAALHLARQAGRRPVRDGAFQRQRHPRLAIPHTQALTAKPVQRSPRRIKAGKTLYNARL